jgi:hypothetical protein
VIFKFKNDNPEFSHLIGKNPSSPPKVSSIRKGAAVGWFNDGYNIKFVDQPDEVSFPDYKDQEYEYLSRGKLCHPFLAFRLLSDYFKLNTEYDKVANNYFELHSVETRKKNLDLFIKHFPHKIEYTQLAWEKFFTLKVSYECSGQEFIDFLRLFTFFLNLDRNEFIQDEQMEPQFKLLKSLDAPYFIRYLFKTNLIRNSKKRFEQYKEYLNDSSTHDYQIKYSNNFQARLDFVTETVRNKDVVDLGCGEGRFRNNVKKCNKSYTGIDRDQYCRDRFKMKHNEETFASWDEYVSEVSQNENKRTVIMSEVLEHSPYEESIKQVKDVANSSIVDYIVLTTPNKAFNKYYHVDSRHDDHDFELTMTQFHDYLSTIGKPFSITPVGDIVNDEPTTFGAVINAN